MTTICLHSSSEKLTLYFYGELSGHERRWIEAHVSTCEACAAALAELQLLRAALASRGEATRPAEQWADFMRRLDVALGGSADARSAFPAPQKARRTWIPAAIAALLLLGIALGLMWQRRALDPAHTLVADAAAGDTALAAAAARHFDRAKLVVLGLAMKDPAHTSADDWKYERELAASLLPETRLFRLSASDRGDAQLEKLLGDLESVLLQTSMASDADPPELQRIQRVIRRRDLLVRMDLREL